VALSNTKYSLIMVVLGPSCAFRAYCVSFRIPGKIRGLLKILNEDTGNAFLLLTRKRHTGRVFLFTSKI
jgi:hypothetical protein